MLNCITHSKYCSKLPTILVMNWSSVLHNQNKQNNYSIYTWIPCSRSNWLLLDTEQRFLSTVPVRIHQQIIRQTPLSIVDFPCSRPLAGHLYFHLPGWGISHPTNVSRWQERKQLRIQLRWADMIVAFSRIRPGQESITATATSARKKKPVLTRSH